MGSLKDSMPTIAMSLLQFGFAVVTLSTRTALAQGMSPRVFVVYRQAIATLFVAPIAYILNRRKATPTTLNMKSLSMLFSASLIGVTINLNCYVQGLYLTSSSTASAMSNLLPAITFVMAAALGLENVDIRSSRSLGKVLGTIVCILGGENWLLGCVYLFGSCCCGSVWLILQVPMFEIYPDHLSISAWMCFFAMLQSGVLTYFLEPNPRAWNLSSNTEILTCFFAGIIGSGVSYYIQSWCISRRGPLFSAMFSPLMTVIVTILACLFLHEELYIGSLVRAIAVVAGLYAVLWGRDNDTETRGDKISGDDGIMTPFIADTNNC
ncbi:hypothetical protein AAC387_Pa07g0461 [Persea americana]